MMHAIAVLNLAVVFASHYTPISGMMHAIGKYTYFRIPYSADTMTTCLPVHLIFFFALIDDEGSGTRRGSSHKESLRSSRSI